MNLSDKIGSITKGKIANLIITNPIKSIDEIPYSLADNKIKNLLLNGKFYKL
jgi:imidazolonepropionase